jgi:hypothetical protein
MSTVRDRLWIWGHEAGSHNQGWSTPGPSRMTPAEGAFYLGVPNMIMVRYEDRPVPPYEQYALSFRPLRRFVWSIVGAGGVTSDEELDHARRLAEKYPNMTGVMMDDFFRHDPANVAVYSAERLQAIRDRLTVAGRRLDLWVVLYQQQLHLPVLEHLARCDVVTYWTWWAERLEMLETDFARMEALAPASRKVLGCYMWDYGNRKPMPLDLMKHQCALGLKWLKEGRIEGMIFLASCICDLELEPVEWTRDWVQAAGDQKIE